MCVICPDLLTSFSMGPHAKVEVMMTMLQRAVFIPDPKTERPVSLSHGEQGVVLFRSQNGKHIRGIKAQLQEVTTSVERCNGNEKVVSIDHDAIYPRNAAYLAEKGSPYLSDQYLKDHVFGSHDPMQSSARVDLLKQLLRITPSVN